MFTPSPKFTMPLNERNALIHAALTRDTDEIDRITARLAQQGVCRPRADMSRLAEWLARRPAPVVERAPIEEVAEHSAIGAEIAAHFRGVFAGAGR